MDEPIENPEPCYCGNLPVYEHTTNDWDTEKEYVVSCPNPYCCIHDVYRIYCDDYMDGFREWNNTLRKMKGKANE